MNPWNLLTIIPHSIIPVIYWSNKEQFLKDEDRHPAWVLLAVESGSFQYEIDGQSDTASFGDIVFCPPGFAFRRKVLEPLSFFIANFIWIKTDRSEPAQLDPIHKIIPVGKIKIHDMDRLASNYTYLQEICKGTFPAAEYRQNVLLSDIWQLYCLESGKQAYINRAQDPLMNKAAALIKRDAYRPFSFKMLSAHLGLSPVQFTRRFKASYDANPTDYLTNLRIRKVKTLLIESHSTLDQIAEQCGYENGFYLSRVFSNKVGMSPSEYRSSHII